MEDGGFGGERVGLIGGGASLVVDMDRVGNCTGGLGCAVWCWMKAVSSMLSSSYASISCQGERDTSQ